MATVASPAEKLMTLEEFAAIARRRCIARAGEREGRRNESAEAQTRVLFARRLAPFCESSLSHESSAVYSATTQESSPNAIRIPCAARMLGSTASRIPGRRSERRYFDVAPELAVEVVSYDDRWAAVLEKVAEYSTRG